MNAAARFITVIALGALLSVMSTLVLLPVFRSSVGTAIGMAFGVAAMRLADDRLAGRRRELWTAIGIGILGGATAWATLALLID